MKQVNVTMTFEDKEFVSEKGEKIPYIAIKANIGGEDVRFSVKTEDKGLLSALLRKIK